jgi:hypothetical protein
MSRQPKRKQVERRDPLGELPRLGHDALESKYQELKQFHERHLAAKGVWLPPFTGRDGLYHQTALALIGLYCRLGLPVTKSELESFVRMYKDGARDVQDGRHLSAQFGWRVLSSHRRDFGTEDWPRSSYGLVSVTESHPSFRRQQDGDLTVEEWAIICDTFDNRCSLCGSKEGEPNLRAPAAMTEIQKGHRDPRKPLSIQNCLPQCQECNRTLRNKFEFDERGRPRALALPELILLSAPEVQKEVLRILKDRFE